MGNCNATIFLRQDCYLPGVRSYLYAISNGGTPDSSRENATDPFVRLLAVLGFLQAGFRRRLQRDTSRFLFWAFLLLGVGWAVDYWTFALSTRFWTVELQKQSDQAHRAYEMSLMLAGYFLKPIVAIGLLNIGLAWFRKRGSRLVPG